MLKSLLCRLNLHHEWHNEFTEDGGRYKRCARCGKDDPRVRGDEGGPGHGSGLEWYGAQDHGA